MCVHVPVPSSVLNVCVCVLTASASVSLSVSGLTTTNIPLSLLRFPWLSDNYNWKASVLESIGCPFTSDELTKVLRRQKADDAVRRKERGDPERARKEYHRRIKLREERSAHSAHNSALRASEIKRLMPKPEAAQPEAAPELRTGYLTEAAANCIGEGAVEVDMHNLPGPVQSTVMQLQEQAHAEQVSRDYDAALTAPNAAAETGMTSASGQSRRSRRVRQRRR